MDSSLSDIEIRDSIISLVQKDLIINIEYKKKILNCILEKKEYTYPFFKNCVLMYKSFCSEFSKEIYNVASSIELMILSLDILDDIQDNDTSHIWSVNPNQSLNWVIAIFLAAIRNVRISPLPNSYYASDIIEEEIFTCLEGQSLDLQNRRVSPEEYIKIIKKKSGSLVALSLTVGQILATGKRNENLQRLGEIIGVIQQLNNDIEGFFTNSCHNDLLNKRYTLPVIYLLEKKDSISLKLLQFYEITSSTTEEIEYLKEIVQGENIIRYCNAIKYIYKNRAIEILEQLDLSDNSYRFLYNSLN